MTLFALLFFGILSMWIEERWAWSVFQVGIFLLAALQLLRQRSFRWDARCSALALATLWPLLQLATGATMGRAVTEEAALNWFTFLVVFLLARQAASERLLRLAALGGAALATVAVLAKFTGQGRIFWLLPTLYTTDVLGPFLSRNQYAAWVELLLPIALYLAIRRGTLYGVAAAILFASVIASGSRAGAALVCIEMVAVIALQRLPRRRHSLVLTVAIASLAVAIGGWADLRDRLQSTGPEPLRADALRASLEMARDHPLMGTGLGTWSRIYPRYAGFDTGLVMNQAHNDWAQWAAEGGLPFFICLFIFAGLLWKPAIRTIYGLGLIAFLLHALIDYPMQQRPALAAWFFAVAGIVTNDLLRRTGDPADGIG